AGGRGCVHGLDAVVERSAATGIRRPTRRDGRSRLGVARGDRIGERRLRRRGARRARVDAAVEAPEVGADARIRRRAVVLVAARQPGMDVVLRLRDAGIGSARRPARTAAAGALAEALSAIAQLTPGVADGRATTASVRELGSKNAALEAKRSGWKASPAIRLRSR